MSKPQLEHLTRQFLALYADKDIETISNMFAENVVLKDWNYEVVGKGAAIQEFQKNFEEAENLSIYIKKILLTEVTAAAEIEVSVNGTKLEIVDVITFNESGLVTAVKAYRCF